MSNYDEIISKIHNEAEQSALAQVAAGVIPKEQIPNYMIGFIESKIALDVELLQEKVEKLDNQIKHLENNIIPITELHTRIKDHINEAVTEIYILKETAWVQFRSENNSWTRMVMGEIDGDQARMRGMITLYVRDKHDLCFLLKMYDYIKLHGIKVK